MAKDERCDPPRPATELLTMRMDPVERRDGHRVARYRLDGCPADDLGRVVLLVGATGSGLSRREPFPLMSWLGDVYAVTGSYYVFRLWPQLKRAASSKIILRPSLPFFALFLPFFALLRPSLPFFVLCPSSLFFWRLSQLIRIFYTIFIIFIIFMNLGEERPSLLIRHSSNTLIKYTHQHSQ